MHRIQPLLLITLALCLSACDGDDDGQPTPPQPLTLVSVTPAANATRVSIDQPIQLLFSAPVDPSTVTTASVSVTTNGLAVPGALAVQGSTVTFTPAISLAEFRTPYTLNVTAVVRSAQGGLLNTALTSSFTTVFFDTAYYYHVTNAAMGASKTLGTVVGVPQCFFVDFGGTSSQQWYINEMPASNAHIFRNRALGDTRALDAGTAGASCVLGDVPAGPSASGQAWTITAEGTGYRLTNPNLGAGVSLGIVLVNNEQRPGMITTSTTAAQSWNFARLAHR